MIEAKEHQVYEYDEEITTELLIPDTEYCAIEKFKKLNNIEDIENVSSYYSILVFRGLLLKEFMHELGKKLKYKLENKDKVVLWVRDAALIPGSKDIKCYIAGESSNTHNGKYYKPIKKFIKECYENNININKKIMKEFILKNIELDDIIKKFNKNINDFIDNSEVCFFDTGFTGAQMFRTSIFLKKDEKVPIILASKNKNIRYAESLNTEEDKVLLIEDIIKPITTYFKFNDTKPYYEKIIEEFKEFDINRKRNRKTRR